MSICTKIGFHRKRDLEFPDFDKRVNQLLGAISESSRGDPLSIEQFEVIIEHLRYALVAGFDAGIDAKG